MTRLKNTNAFCDTLIGFLPHDRNRAKSFLSQEKGFKSQFEAEVLWNGCKSNVNSSNAPGGNRTETKGGLEKEEPHEFQKCQVDCSITWPIQQSSKLFWCSAQTTSF